MCIIYIYMHILYIYMHILYIYYIKKYIVYVCILYIICNYIYYIILCYIYIYSQEIPGYSYLKRGLPVFPPYFPPPWRTDAPAPIPRRSQGGHGKFGVKKWDPESINLVVVQGIRLFFAFLKRRGWVKTVDSIAKKSDGFGNKQMRQNSITTRNWIPGIWSLRPTPPHFGTFLVI